MQAYFRHRSPELPLPLRAYVEVLGPAVHGLTPTEILFACQRVAEREADVVQIARGPAPAGNIAIRIGTDQVVFDIGGVTTSTLHYDESYEPGEDGTQLAIDALALGALAFDQIGHSQVASRLTAAFIEDSGFLDHPEVPWALSGSMARARRVVESLRLVERLDAAGQDRADAAAFVFTIPALIHSASLDSAEGEELERILRLRGDRIAGRPARPDLRLLTLIATPPARALRRPIEFAQYTSLAYTDRLDELGAAPSVGSRGDAYDNAMAEAWVATFKTELVDGRRFPSHEHAEHETLHWIGFYNDQRLHEQLDDLPPTEYEELNYKTDNTRIVSTTSASL